MTMAKKYKKRFAKMRRRCTTGIVIPGVAIISCQAVSAQQIAAGASSVSEPGIRLFRSLYRDPMTDTLLASVRFARPSVLNAYAAVPGNTGMEAAYGWQARGESVSRPLWQSGLGLSRIGATGLIIMPNAEVVPDGSLDIDGFGHTKQGSSTYTVIGSRNTATAAFGIVPNVEFAVEVGDDSQADDLQFGAKWQILRDSSHAPAFAVGVGEEGKGGGATSTQASTRAPATEYAVASHQFLDGRLNASLGLRRHSGTRPFGGVEIGIVRGVAAMAEDDGYNINLGVRAGFLNDRLHVSVAHEQGSWNVQGGVRFTFKTDEGGIPTAVDIPHPGAAMSDDDAMRAVAAHLRANELEYITVRIAGPTLQVQYEDRSFPHNPMDSLAAVLAIAAAYSPDHVSQVSVIIKRDGIPIIRVGCPLADYREFMKGGDDRQFANVLTVDHETGEPLQGAPISADSGTRNSAAGHSDLFVRATVNNLFAANGLLFLGVNLTPELQTPIAPAVTTDVRAMIPVAGPIRASNTAIDRAEVNYSSKPAGPYLLRAEMGRFPNSRDGAQFEALWTPDSQPILGKLAVDVLHRTDGLAQKVVLLAEGRYYLPYLNANLFIEGGRFLDGDTGFAAGLVRHFGDTDIGLDVRDTSYGNVAEMTLTFPLGPGYLGEAPSVVRVRPPDFFTLTERTLFGSGQNYLAISNVVGNELSVREDATGRLLFNDRLNRQYIMRSVKLLRRARAVQDLH